MQSKPNEHIFRDLLRLRDELGKEAFTCEGTCKDTTKAEIVYKINSCLFKGYPSRG